MPAPRAATFFDVDGTLVKTTIAHYYAYFRRSRLPRLTGHLWYGWFISKCAYYLLLDKINRSMMNVVFYRSYRGLPVNEIRDLSVRCYLDVIRPRQFAQAAECVREHQEAGREVVLVTGSIDFIMEPLAQELGIRSMVASKLVESDGHFTGELEGPPIGEEEKARRIREFAQEHGIDLENSYGYGDSIADLPMLQAVGKPAVVNPDAALAAEADRRGWPKLEWTIDDRPAGGAS
jgi:HAD superfamily hydrolase (TIGR01490 family)